jgi:hypothetical protein
VKAVASPDNVMLTSEGLMIYLQERLTGLDSQIKVLFGKQKNLQSIRHLREEDQSARDLSRTALDMLAETNRTETSTYPAALFRA